MAIMNFEVEPFIQKFTTGLSAYEGQLRSLSIDHFCYRTDSLESYALVKKHFSQQGTLLIESPVGGRAIATYKLASPIIFGDYYVDLIEVPAPKPARAHENGFEHLEMVIAKPFTWVEQNFTTKSIKGATLEKGLNPEAEVAFQDFALKFHHKSLEHIIALEKNHQVMNALKDTKILEQFQDFHPLISGTLPLEIATPESDLDILCQHEDLDFFIHYCSQHFQSAVDFSVRKANHQGLESAIIGFSAKDLKIELFCQNKSVYEQTANLHFLAESKLLKVGGAKLRADVIRLKQQGKKTEPAFGELLGLNDPYRELELMAHQSDGELYQRFKDYSS